MLAAMENVTKYFSDRLILKNVSLTVEDNDRIGLIGPNGAGKSTLLHLLTKKLSADEGSVSHQGGVAIGILEQNSGLSRESTIYGEMRSVFSALLETERTLRDMESRIASMDVASAEYAPLCEEYSRLHSWFEAQEGYQIDLKIKTVLNGMGFEDKSYDFVIRDLSGGEKTRLALAKLLLESPGLLILDEPTNHLDFKTLLWLEDYLQSYRGGLLLVSHDRYFLDKLVHKIWDVEGKTVVTYPGNYSKYKILREERLKRLNREYETQQNKIASMRDYAERNIVRASTSNMAKSRLHQLEHIELIEKPVDVTPTPQFHFEFDRSPVKDLLAVKDLTLEVGQAEDHRILSEGLNFEIKRGEKIALIGPNGVGKSTLLKTLLGRLPANGEIYWGANVKTGYYEQENLTLDREKTALQELWDRFPRKAEFELRSILGQVLITGENAFKPIGVLSGGERARVALAVLMLERSNTLLLDEPTNHLDLQSKESLEQALTKFEGTLLFVSHDRYFLNAIPTRILELTGKELRIYNGNYDFYLEQKSKEDEAAALAAAAEKSTPKENGQAYYRSKLERSEQVKRKKRIALLEGEIEESDRRISELTEQMSLPEIAADYEQLTAVCADLEAEKEHHDTLFAEWISLSDEDN